MENTSRQRSTLLAAGGGLLLLLSFLLAGAAPALGEESSAPSLETVQALLDKGEFAEAEEQARSLLTEAEDRDGPVSLRAAAVLDLLGYALREGGKYAEAEALELADRSLEIRRELLAPDDPEVGASLVSKAWLLVRRFELTEAESLFREALEIYREALGPSAEEVAEAHEGLAASLYRQGEYQSAKAQAEAALEIYAAAGEGESLDAASAMQSLANALADLGEAERAEALYRSILAIQKAELGPLHPKVGGTLNNLGRLQLEMGRLAVAEETMREAIEVKRAALGSRDANVAMSLGNLAIIYDQMARTAAAESVYREALEIFEVSLGPDHPYVGFTLGNLGTLQLNRSDYTGARESYEKTLALFERAGLEAGSPEIVWMMLALFQANRLLGDDAAAQRYLDRAMEYWAAHPEGLDLYRGSTFREAAAWSKVRGDLEAAGRFYSETLAIYRKAFGAGSWHTAAVEVGLAEVQIEREDLAAAEANLDRALAALGSELGGRHPETAWARVVLGDLRVAQGDCPTALEQYNSALEVMRASGMYAKETAEIPLRIARCLARIGETQKAIEAALESEELSMLQLRKMLSGLEERVGLEYSASRESGLDLALSLATFESQTEAAVRILDAVIRSRAVVFDELAARQGLLGADDPRVRQLFGELSAARERLSYLAVRAADDPESLEIVRTQVADALAERDEAERGLAEASRRFRAQRSIRRIGFEDVVAWMPEGSGLVSYVRIAGHDRTGDGRGAWYVALVLRPTGSVTVPISLGSAAEIDELVALVRALLSEESLAGGGVGGDAAEREFRREAKNLREKIWDPLVPHLADVRQLFVVPDGPLHLVSFGALPLDSSAYLVERGPAIHYLGAERDLVADREGVSGKGMLLVGDPDFDARDRSAAAPPVDLELRASLPASRPFLVQPHVRSARSSCGSLDSVRFESLPESAAEVDEVSAAWVRSASGDMTSVEVLKRSAAGEAAVKARAPGRRILHLATHGFFLGSDCPSPLDRSSATARTRKIKWTELESPLLRSGLALAGANHRGSTDAGENDGILTAEEVAAIDLNEVEWAVLSACDSGLGEIDSGEGVLGLRRAFALAGARTLIMSLWQISDDATREWMSALYRHRLIDGMSTVESANQASLQLLRSRREAGLSTHPFYWAGFVAAGDWR